MDFFFLGGVSGSVIMNPNNYLNSSRIYILLFLMKLIIGFLLFVNLILALSLCGHILDRSLFFKLRFVELL